MDETNDSLSKAYFLGMLRYYIVLFGLELEPVEGGPEAIIYSL